MEKSFEEKKAADHLRSHTQPEKLRGSRKYKSRSPRSDARFIDKILAAGSVVVCRANVRGNVEGYLLTEVVDFNDNEDTWDANTTLIVKVTDGSNPKMKTMIGRYKIAKTAGYYFGGALEMVDIGKGAWGDFRGGD